MARSRKNVPLKDVLPSLFQLGRTFWPEIRKQRKLLGLAFLALLLSIAGRVLVPWPLKFIFDWVIMPTDNPDLASGVLKSRIDGVVDDAGMLLGLLAVALVVFTAIHAFFEYYSRVTMSLAATRIVTRIRANLFSHLQRLSLRFHNKAKSGDLIARFTYDVKRVRDAAVTALLPLIANLVTITVMFIVMFWFNWQLALMPLAVLPLFYIKSVQITRQIQSVSRDHRRQDSALASTAAEAIGSIKSVQALSLAKLNERAFARNNKKSLNEGAKAQRLAAGLSRKIDVILSVVTALVLWKGASLVVNDVITPGTLLLFVTYLKYVFNPMRQTARALTRLSRATASGERIQEILEIEPEIRDHEDAVTADGIRGQIRFEDVSFGYGKKKILEGLNMEISSGERVALVGPSGEGKSTLLSLLLRLYDPTEGRVLVDGRDIREYKVESLRQQFGIVLQDSALFAVSIADNIAYGNQDAGPDAIERAARRANAHDFITGLEDGYETVLAERGTTLSGGQLQRIAIARAVIREAPIMILDEPTLGLDNKNRMEVNRALENSMQGRTAVLVTHDLEASRHFDRIMVIEGGRITEMGTHEELMDKKGTYHRLYLKQYNTGDRAGIHLAVNPGVASS